MVIYLLQAIQPASALTQEIIFYGSVSLALLGIYKVYTILRRWTKEKINAMIAAQLVQQNSAMNKTLDQILQKVNSGSGNTDMIKNVSETVARVESRQQALLDARDNEKGMFECEKDGRMRFVNNKFCYLLGRTKQDVLGYGWYNYISFASREEVIDEFKESIDQQREFQKEFTMDTSSRFKTIRVIMRTTRMIDPTTQNILGYLGSLEEKI